MQIREHAQATPDKPAVILYPSGTVVTFGDLEARANRLAHLFRQAGLREGDPVAILMENNEHFHMAMWAARRAGLYYVPINTHLTAAEASGLLGSLSRRRCAASLRRAGGRASHGPRHSSWDSRAPSRAHALHPEQRSRFLLDRQLAAAALAAAVHGAVLVAPEETALLPSTVDASLDPTRLRCFADFSTSPAEPERTL
jgi:non-ribosomal peptide synthetase component F